MKQLVVVVALIMILISGTTVGHVASADTKSMQGTQNSPKDLFSNIFSGNSLTDFFSNLSGGNGNNNKDTGGNHDYITTAFATTLNSNNNDNQQQNCEVDTERHTPGGESTFEFDTQGGDHIIVKHHTSGGDDITERHTGQRDIV
ncbi:MAG: hypothetical protein E6L05_04990, partial [Thaumarchaeota archaeon]